MAIAQRLAPLVFAWLLVSWASACASSGDLISAAGPCQSDEDCPGSSCDLSRQRCRATTGTGGTGSGGSANNGLDAGSNDASTSDANNGAPGPNNGGSDGGLGSTDASGQTNNGTGGTQNNTNLPAPGPQDFSGCTQDVDCLSYQRCDVALGRCTDTRRTCESDAQCAGIGSCFLGHCAPPCNATNGINACQDGLTCVTVEGQGAFCMALCQGFDAYDGQCGPDAQCVPYIRRDLGLCRGIGNRQPGQACAPDNGPTECIKGSTCVSNGQGGGTCRPLCANANGPTCAGGTMCAAIYNANSDPAIDAGVCLTDCGGSTNFNPGACQSGETCFPDGDTRGYCLNDSTVLPNGASCPFNGPPFCQPRSYCLAAGQGALDGNPTEGVCVPGCTPGVTDCGADAVCFPGEQDPSSGVCRPTCDPKLTAANNGCPAGLGRCLPQRTNQLVPPDRGLCIAAGTLAGGAACSDAAPLQCNADDICANANNTFGDASAGANPGMSCTRYCHSLDYSGAANRCSPGQVCATLSYGFTEGMGFCTSRRTPTTLGEGQNCGTQVGMWCNDNLLCNRWLPSDSIATCRTPCFTDVGGTCRPGASCVGAGLNPPEFGSCQ